MRVMQWVFPLHRSRGGREVFAINLSNSLAEANVDVLVVSDPPVLPARGTGVPLGPTNKSIDLHSQHVPLSRHLTNLRETIQATMDSFRPDIIHVHNPTGSDVALLLAATKDTPIRLVYTEHENVRHRHTSGISQRHVLFSRLDALIAPSKSVMGDIRAEFPNQVGRIRVIANGVPKHGAHIESVNEKQVFASGRLAPEKGFSTLLTAWSLVTSDHPGARLVIAGDGNRHEAYETLAAKLGIAESVRFMGWLVGEELERVLSESSFVVVPSTWAEPFGLVAVEAGMAGKAVLGSRSGAIPEIVEHGKTGLLVEAGDVPEFASGLDYLLREPLTARKLGLANQARVIDRYSLQRCVQEHINLYTEVLS